MRMGILASAAALATAFAAAAPAMAADLAAFPPAPAPYVQAPAPYPPVFTWTGGYVGLNVGVGLADRTLTTNTYDQFGNFVHDDARTTGSGVLGGAQGGYNYQFNQLVVGFETDFQGTGYRAARDDNTYDNFGDNFSQGLSSSIDYYGTVRGRVGYAYDRALFYATGGFAYGRVVNDGYNYLSSPFGNASAVYHAGQLRPGYVVGGGVEYAITNNMSVRAEYQFVNLGTSNLVSGPGAVSHVNNTLNVARVGLNYKFNDVVAGGFGGLPVFSSLGSYVHF